MSAGSNKKNADMNKLTTEAKKPIHFDSGFSIWSDAAG
ncbi:hypothetical protein VISP3789_01350 [Vibrio splendidus ATCC 33789]|nr:hypothetical protein VISP3789_01350 [Vibrio splendidus ATCC 33789]